MRENFIARLQELPDLLGGHLILSISAIIVGLVISVPLGVVASRSPRLRSTFLAIASVTQTIPSMALLALMVPLLGGMIGFLPRLPGTHRIQHVAHASKHRYRSD